MKINDVLIQMEASALDSVFTRSIEAIYLEHVRRDHLDETENEYGAAKARLMPILSEEKAASLQELETLYAENMAYASRFGFKCGMLSRMPDFTIF